VKRLAILALAVAVTCGAIASTVTGRASSLYPVVVQMKGEGATMTVFSPTNANIRATFFVPANSTKSVAMENAPVYEFRMTACGKTHISRWNRVGAGVNVTARACEGFSFSQR
jgi:hypothetical protein